MSTWLQNILIKRRILFLQILIISLLLHLVVLISFLFSKKADTVKFSVIKNFNMNVPVLFVPFAKTYGVLNNIQNSVKKNKPTDLEVKRLTKPIKKNEKKVVQSKVMQKQSPIKAEKSKNNLIDIKKDMSKKNLENKKVEETKIEPVLSKVEGPVKNKPKLEESSYAKATTDKSADKQEIEEPKTEIIKTESQSGAPEVNLSEEPVIIGRDDVQTFDAYVEIQDQINENWMPPTGFKNLSCEIKCLISQDGIILKTSVEKSSGALAFDVSAKMVLKKMVWPKLCWGKEIIITFR